MKFHIHRPEELGLSERDNSANLDEPRMVSSWKGKVRDENDFKQARSGDHLMIPFECDSCVFIKLKGRLPHLDSPSDLLLSSCIRRMILDAFWSRETSTIRANTRRVNKLIEVASTFQIPGPFFYEGTLPLHDHCGYRIGVSILLLSRNPGKHDRSYTQYDTLRTYRATYGNFIRASPQTNSSPFSLGDQNGHYQRLTQDESGSLFFRRFMVGLRTRMGQIHKPNLAMSLDLLLKLIFKIKEKLKDAEGVLEEEHCLSSVLTYVAVSYVTSLRGPEGFLLDLKGLNNHWDRSPDYVTIALLGRLKGEQHDLQHLIPCSNLTLSGIDIRTIIQDHLEVKSKAELFVGPAISNHEGILLSTKYVDDTVAELLNDIFHSDQNLFPPTIDSPDKISYSYQCFRSFRRTSATRATEMGISSNDVDTINRWQDRENKKSSKPASSMHQHYTQFDLLIKPFLRYTSQM